MTPKQKRILTEYLADSPGGWAKLYQTHNGIGDGLMLGTAAENYFRQTGRKMLVTHPQESLFVNNPGVVFVPGLSQNPGKLDESLRKELAAMMVYPVFIHARNLGQTQDGVYFPYYLPVNLTAAMCSRLELTGTVNVIPHLELGEREKKFGSLFKGMVAIMADGLEPYKDWGFENMQRLVNEFQGQCNFVQLGTLKDTPLEGVYDLRGKCSLLDSAAVLHYARLFIGNIGGLMHLARAVDCPGLILASSGEYEEYLYPEYRNIRNTNGCTWCLDNQFHWNYCNRDFCCTNNIPYEKVKTALAEELASPRPELPRERFLPIPQMEPVRGLEDLARLKDACGSSIGFFYRDEQEGDKRFARRTVMHDTTHSYTVTYKVPVEAASSEIFKLIFERNRFSYEINRLVMFDPEGNITFEFTSAGENDLNISGGICIRFEERRIFKPLKPKFIFTIPNESTVAEIRLELTMCKAAELLKEIPSKPKSTSKARNWLEHRYDLCKEHYARDGFSGVAAKIWGKVLKKVFKLDRHIQKIRAPQKNSQALAEALAREVEPNKIVVCCHSGNGYSCNPRAIVEEIIRRQLPYDIVWLADLTKCSPDDFPPEIRLALSNSAQGIEELATAKVWIDNQLKIHTYDKGLRKRPEQMYIQTWHGSLGLKRLDRMNMSPREKAMLRQNDQEIDFVTIDSGFEHEVLRTSLFPDAKLLRCGHPRNAILFDRKRSEAIRNQVSEKLGLSPDEHVILYAPTFRASGDMTCYRMDCRRMLQAFETRFGGKWRLLYRLHRNISNKARDPGLFPPEYCQNVSDYPDIQDLMLLADAMISDYSSCICDYIFTRRPGFLFTVDLEEYRDKDWGFYYPLETTPFPIGVDDDSMVRNILNFDMEKYQRDIDSFLVARDCMEDGKAAERVVDIIEEFIGEPEVSPAAKPAFRQAPAEELPAL